MAHALTNNIVSHRGVIGEVRCGFLRIYTPTNAVFLLHALAPAPLLIYFDMCQNHMLTSKLVRTL